MNYLTVKYEPQEERQLYTQEYVDFLNSRHADQVRDLKEHIGWLEAKNKSLRKQNTALRKEIKSWYKAVENI